MHPWFPSNDRQLALLTRIGDGPDPVTSDSPELAVTARALRDRGLVIMPRKKGRWQAEITEAGRFYLEHGHHPDRPELAPRKPRAAASEAETPVAAGPQQDADPPTETKPVSKRAVKPPRPSPAAVGPALIAQVQESGRSLRTPDPGPQCRGAGSVSQGVRRSTAVRSGRVPPEVHRDIRSPSLSSEGHRKRTCNSRELATNSTISTAGRGSSAAADDVEPALCALGHGAAGHRDR